MNMDRSVNIRITSMITPIVMTTRIMGRVMSIRASTHTTIMTMAMAGLTPICPRERMERR